MASANDSSKRRRLLDDASPHIKCLSDLPSGVLTHVASYLVAPTRALFAASLAINQNASTASDERNAAIDERNAAIVDHEWSTLDFGDIEKDLVTRLTDRDIERVLQCVDAVNKLKRLKLTNCTNIFGTCLEPLRGSFIIEQIDLSLVEKHQSPDLDSEPPISCAHVLPILDSIIEREGCALRHLQFPKVWREEGRRRNNDDEGSAQFVQFLRRYNIFLRNRGANLGVIGCGKCNRNVVVPENENWIDFSGRRCYCFESSHYGIQNYMCYECLKNYCEHCAEACAAYGGLSYCERCERELCGHCSNIVFCSECQLQYCLDCEDPIECSVCNDFYRCKDSNCKDEWRFCCKCERHFCGGSESAHCANDNANKFCCHGNGCRKECCNDCEQEYGWLFCSRCEWYQFCDDCNEKQGMMQYECARFVTSTPVVDVWFQ